MSQKNRISETEWKQLLPQMASFAHITTDIGYSVLVKGEKSSDVAMRVGRSKQNISSTVKRIWDLYQNTTLKAENGEPLKLVQVWIPASLAETVLKEAAKYSLITSRPRKWKKNKVRKDFILRLLTRLYYSARHHSKPLSPVYPRD
ncbi:transcriptional regulator KorA (plasmid) [Raoultella planticola]|uniref:Transcriptional regulator KorA n=1 Tax=Raoultella planticola TaxID=575 RepID=A0A9Q9T068_RAOPL|nr:transcriptional regulator KorA [Raoultella planticola]